MKIWISRKTRRDLAEISQLATELAEERTEHQRTIHRTVEIAAERDDARMWARHGYELGQRSCTWADHGVAPEWLTENHPIHFAVPTEETGDTP